MRLVSWGQGPGFYVLTSDLADLLLGLATAFNAIVFITVRTDGAPEPLLLPREVCR